MDGTREKIFVCTICGAQFPYKYAFYDHITLKHLERKPYECKICGKSFALNNFLDLHLKVHSEMKQCGTFHCDVCSLSFSSSSIHKKHMEMHASDYGTKAEIDSNVKDQIEKYGNVEIKEEPQECEPGIILAGNEMDSFVKCDIDGVKEESVEVYEYGNIEPQEDPLSFIDRNDGSILHKEKKVLIKCEDHKIKEEIDELSSFEYDNLSIKPEPIIK